MNVNVHKIEVIVLDFNNNSDIENVISELENSKYYSVQVKQHQTAVIPEWTDDHPLNKHSTQEQAIKELFNE